MAADLVCFSHLRWDHVFQRPNHLMVRATRTRRVLCVEQPIERRGRSGIEMVARDGVLVATPHVDPALTEPERAAQLEQVVREPLASLGFERPTLWYYDPMAVSWTEAIEARAVVYDCMDELSAFRLAPRELLLRERRLFARADVVFTGGESLYESKRPHHPNVHAFPSGVDLGHFRQARRILAEPVDQAPIPRPRVGWFGVIDERFDRELVERAAALRPGWSWVLVGPTAKVEPDEVPVAPNIHLLGQRSYAHLPAYLAGWDVAVMPFARNEATRDISPTKTPEYLAGGIPVVSTSIRDVVEPYGRLGLVRIADTPEAFVEAIEASLPGLTVETLERVDAFLEERTWDRTWAGMDTILRGIERSRRAAELVPAASRLAAAG